MKYYFEKLKNIIDFSLRQRIAYSRVNYSEQDESKEELFKSQDEIDREKYLFEKYDLENVKASGTRRNYLENLYMLDILDKYLCINHFENLKAIDIGSSNWFYAKGQYHFFKDKSSNITLRGIELDANRLNTKLYSRKEIARFHTKSLKNAEYISGSFLDHKEKYDFIIWILPFVFEYPLSKWGLPMSYFKPVEMLNHAYSLLEKGGQMFIVNQGEQEYNAQKALYSALDINFQDIGLIGSSFDVYKKERYLTLVEKI